MSLSLKKDHRIEERFLRYIRNLITRQRMMMNDSNTTRDPSNSESLPKPILQNSTCKPSRILPFYQQRLLQAYHHTPLKLKFLNYLKKLSHAYACMDSFDQIGISRKKNTW